MSSLSLPKLTISMHITVALEATAYKYNGLVKSITDEFILIVVGTVAVSFDSIVGEAEWKDILNIYTL